MTVMPAIWVTMYIFILFLIPSLSHLFLFFRADKIWGIHTFSTIIELLTHFQPICLISILKIHSDFYDDIIWPMHSHDDEYNATQMEFKINTSCAKQENIICEF